LRQLDSLTIAGDFTEAGVLRLRQHPGLTCLWVVPPRRLSDDIGDKLGADLPTLFFFQYGSDWQRMRSARFTEARVRVN